MNGHGIHYVLYTKHQGGRQKKLNTSLYYTARQSPLAKNVNS